MKRSAGAIIVLAACHLVLVVCGALGVRVDRVGGSVGRLLRWYGALSGADSGYGFFAPNVDSQCRVTFTMTDAAGRSWTDTLDQGSNRETQARLDSILGNPWFYRPRDDVLQSWAAVMFARHPQSCRVTVRVEGYPLPTMTEYQIGQRPEWRPAWEMVFTRAGNPEPVQEPSS